MRSNNWDQRLQKLSNPISFCGEAQQGLNAERPETAEILVQKSARKAGAKPPRHLNIST